MIAHAKIKTDAIDAAVVAKLYATGFLPEVWLPDARTQALRRQVARRVQLVRQRVRLKNIIQSILHAHLVPPCPPETSSASAVGSGYRSRSFHRTSGPRSSGISPEQATSPVPPSGSRSTASPHPSKAALPDAPRHHHSVHFYRSLTLPALSARRRGHRPSHLTPRSWGLNDERILRVRKISRLHPNPLLSQPGKRSGKLKLQTVQFPGGRSTRDAKY